MLTLGDNAYPDGSAGDYARYYGPTWGRPDIKSRTRPAPGNHEYVTKGAAGYYHYFGAAAGDPGKGFYSFNLSAWHHPRFFSPAIEPGASHLETSDTRMSAIWGDLQSAGANLVLSGHRHVYERFPCQDSSGRLDPTGVRQFIVGTGGALHETFKGKPAPHSQVRKDQTLGGLTLTLHPGGYDWRFIPTAGGFTDSGSDTCG